MNNFPVYYGDVLRNSAVDLSDIIKIYNDATLFTTGYENSDVNGDNIVDLTDITIAYNNAINFVVKITP